MRDFSYQVERASHWFFSDRIPVTKSVIVCNAITFLLITFGGSSLVELLGYSTNTLLLKPWTAFTYPLIGTQDVISLLFASYWMWVAGGSLERSWSSRVFGVYFFLMSAITALGLYLGQLITGIPTSYAGLWLPLAGTTIAFAMLNPEQQILFFFIIPMKLKYLALLDVVLVLVSFARPNPLLGVFALSGCAVSYWYVRYRSNISFSTPRRQSQGNILRVYSRRGFWSKLNPFRAIRESRERKRLRDLFERSDFEE